MWQNAGSAKPKDVELTFTQTAGTTSIGNYEGIFYGAGSGPTFSFYPGLAMRNGVWSPPEGVGVPTPNLMHIRDPASQRAGGQADTAPRAQQTFKEMEERSFVRSNTRRWFTPVNNNWFMDPSSLYPQAPLWMTSGP